MASLKEFIAGGGRGGTILISDFDGTIYRGLCPSVCRGIANADLGLCCCLLHLASPRLFLRLCLALVSLWLLERRLRRRYRENGITLTEMDQALIEYFTIHVLRRCDERKLDTAALLVSGLCYRQAWRSIEKLRGFTLMVIMSKSFSFVLDKVKDAARDACGVEVRCFGVELQPEPPSRIDHQRSLLTSDDKFKYVIALLGKERHITRALVVGDTEDDIPLRNAAVQVLGKENVFFMSVNAKDRVIQKECDRNYRSWQEVCASL